MFTQLCILISCALLASGARTTNSRPMPDGRIVGGFQIDITQVPWQASMQKSGQHGCGASVISSKWILTAAHCLIGASDVSVRVGSATSSWGGTIYRVKRMISHENFNPQTVDYDFALLELERPIQFNQAVQAVPLIGRYQRIPDNSMTLVTGWGTTQNSRESNLVLRGVELPIINQQSCSAAYRGFGIITPRMMCAGFLNRGGKDSCQGDSGGPMVVYDTFTQKAMQIGVVSWGYGCATSTYPGVYARITEARDWIYRHTGI